MKMYIKLINKINNLKGYRFNFKKNGGFGMNELLGIAAALILAAFIIIPGLRDFTGTVMTRLSAWWTGSVMGNIFPTT